MVSWSVLHSRVILFANNIKKEDLRPEDIMNKKEIIGLLLAIICIVLVRSVTYCAYLIHPVAGIVVGGLICCVIGKFLMEDEQ